MTPYSFQKELIGTMEAGGRFVALRMDVAYPLTDGRDGNFIPYYVIPMQKVSRA